MTHFQNFIPKRPLAVCFDIGNVLVLPNGENMADLLAERYGVLFDPERCRYALMRADSEGYDPQRPLQGHTPASMKRSFAKHAGLLPEQAEEAWELLMTANRTVIRWWSDVDPQAGHVLTTLADHGVQLAVVSNADEYLLPDLRDFGLIEHFPVIINSNAVGVSKPDPLIYRIGAEQLGLRPEECWYIGDTAQEMHGAQEAGYGGMIHFDPLNLYEGIVEFPRIQSLDQLLVLFEDTVEAR